MPKFAPLVLFEAEESLFEKSGCLKLRAGGILKLEAFEESFPEAGFASCEAGDVCLGAGFQTVGEVVFLERVAGVVSTDEIKDCWSVRMFFEHVGKIPS